MGYAVKKLGLPRASGRFVVRYEQSYDNTGHWDVKWDPSLTQITSVTIGQYDHRSCEIEVSWNANLGTSDLKGNIYLTSDTGEVENGTLPVVHYYRNQGYYPTANNSLTIPASGGSAEITYISGKYDLASWDVSVTRAYNVTKVTTLDEDSCAVKFRIDISAGNDDLDGSIQLNGRDVGNMITSWTYYFKIAGEEDPRCSIVLTPSELDVTAKGGEIGPIKIEFNPTGHRASSATVDDPLLTFSRIVDGTYLFLRCAENTYTQSRKINTIIRVKYDDNKWEVGQHWAVNQLPTQFNLGPTEFTVPSEGGTFTLTGPCSDNIPDRISYTYTQPWLSDAQLIASYLQEGRLTFKVAPNTTDEPRTGTIRAKVSLDDGNPLYWLVINVKQKGTGLSPIWRDTIFTKNILNDTFEYHLDVDGQTVYAGKAYKYPDNDYIEFFLNNVVEDYLGNSLEFKDGLQVMNNYVKEITLLSDDGTDETFNFFNDWSYKDRGINSFLSDPINGILDPRQYFISSMFLDGTQSPTLDVNGSSGTTFVLKGLNGYTVVRKLSNYNYACGSKITFGISGNKLSYSLTGCKDYVLYYSNAAGGWDSLLIDGNVKKTDKIKSENYTKRVKYPSVEFGKVKYLNTITPEWSLNTGWMSDEQSAKMFNLFESTCVYLHNLVEDEIYPVIVTSNTCEYKTYANNGKKRYNYTIEVEASQDKYRK